MNPLYRNQRIEKKHRHGIQLFALTALCIPAGIWFFYGSAVMKKIWPVIVIANLILFVLFMWKGKQNKENTKVQEPENHEKVSYSNPINQRDEDQEEEEKFLPDESMSFDAEPCQTVVLAECKNDDSVRKLKGLENGTEDIRISYFPFIIGKQENLVDYTLQRETISRIHLKIDKTEEGYEVTDLNSRNGTVVRGEMLEMNETVTIYPGDEIYLADVGYRFV